MFSTRKIFATLVLSGLVAVGLTGTVSAQTNNKPVVKELPQYKGTFYLPGTSIYPNQQNGNWRCDYANIHRYASQLEKDADRLHDAVDNRYSRTNAYRALHSEVQNLESLSKRIHDLADRKANAAIIFNELAKANRSAQYIDAAITEMSRFRDIDRDTVRTLRRRLDDVNDTIDRMAREIRN